MAGFSWKGSWSAGDALPDVLEPLRDAIEKTVRPYNLIGHKLDAKAPPWVSKYAGRPYLPKGEALPTDPDGRLLAPVVQVNFAEMPPLDGHPSAGILTLYLGDVGGAVDEPTQQDHWRLLYFPDVIEDEAALEDCHELIEADAFSEAHFKKQARLTFEPRLGPCTPSDARFEAFFGVSSPWDLFPDDDKACDRAFDALAEISNSMANKIGGYASPEQEDPRVSRAAAFADSLIQLAHDERGSFEVGINLFADPASVASAAFDRVFFYWACD